MSFLKNKSNGCIHAADRATIFYLLHKNWNKLVVAWVQVESIENQSNNSRGIKLLGTTWLPSLYPRDAGEIRSQWTIFSTSIAEASRRSCGCKVVSAWISPNQMGDTDSDSVTLSFANKLKKESCSVLSSLWNYRCSWRVPPHQTECILIGSCVLEEFDDVMEKDFRSSLKWFYQTVRWDSEFVSGALFTRCILGVGHCWPQMKP